MSKPTPEPTPDPAPEQQPGAVEPFGTTTGGLPYPETSGPANQGANDIKALALAVDVLHGSTGLSFRCGSSVVTTDSNGAAVIPISPAFNQEYWPGIGCLPIAMQGDNVASLVASVASQAWQSQWTVLLKQPGGAPMTGTFRVNWIAAGLK